MPRVSAAKKAADRPAPEPIKVKALQRGYYAIAVVDDYKQFDGTKKREIGRNDVIRNEGEVFEYDAVDMPLVGQLKEWQLADRETVKCSRGEVALPRWVTLASKREKETEPTGHTKTFGNATSIKKDDDDVL